MLISWKRFSPGYITGGRRYVSFRFPRKERWYLRNKRSRLNALLAIRAINGASTLISCLRYLPPPLARQWWDINTGRDVFALIDFRLSPPLFEYRVIRSDLHRQFLKKRDACSIRSRWICNLSIQMWINKSMLESYHCEWYRTTKFQNDRCDEQLLEPR